MLAINKFLKIFLETFDEKVSFITFKEQER